MILVTVQPGQELKHTLTEELARRGIANGAIVSLIGAVEGCGISTMAAHDDAEDVVTDYPEPMELSGSGEVVNGVVHLHVVLGRHGDVVRVWLLPWSETAR